MAIPLTVEGVIKFGPLVAEALGVLAVAAGAAGTGITAGRAFDAYTSIDASDLMDRRMRQTSGELRACHELCRAMVYAHIDSIQWLNANLSGRPLENLIPLVTVTRIDPPDLHLLFLPMMTEGVQTDDEIKGELARQIRGPAATEKDWDLLTPKEVATGLFAGKLTNIGGLLTPDMAPYLEGGEKEVYEATLAAAGRLAAEKGVTRQMVAEINQDTFWKSAKKALKTDKMDMCRTPVPGKIIDLLGLP